MAITFKNRPQLYAADTVLDALPRETIKVSANGTIQLLPETLKHLELGFQGEHLVTKINFDLSEVKDTALIATNYIQELIFTKDGQSIKQEITGSEYKVSKEITAHPGIYDIVYIIKEKDDTQPNDPDNVDNAVEIFTSSVFQGVVLPSLAPNIVELEPSFIEAGTSTQAIKKPTINFQWDQKAVLSPVNPKQILGYKHDQYITDLYVPKYETSIIDADIYSIIFLNVEKNIVAYYKLDNNNKTFIPAEVTDEVGNWLFSVRAENTITGEIKYSNILGLTVVDNKLNETSPILFADVESLQVPSENGPIDLHSAQEFAAADKYILTFTGEKVQELLNKVDNGSLDIKLATEDKIGGIKAAVALPGDIQEIRIDPETGKLKTAPGVSGEKASVQDSILSFDTLGEATVTAQIAINKDTVANEPLKTITLNHKVYNIIPPQNITIEQIKDPNITLITIDGTEYAIEQPTETWSFTIKDSSGIEQTITKKVVVLG